jgi:hypothetical protein
MAENDPNTLLVQANETLDTLGDLALEDLADADQAPEDIIEVAYRHKGIAHFQIGEFEFVNHILVIRGTRTKVEAKVEEFKSLYRGLHSSDKIAIVKLRNVRNEEGVDEPTEQVRPTTIRGAVATNEIADREAGRERDLLKQQGNVVTQAPAPAARPGFNFRGTQQK